MQNCYSNNESHGCQGGRESICWQSNISVQHASDMSLAWEVSILGLLSIFVCCFIATRCCTLRDRKLLWVVVGVATEELSPQLVSNQELQTLKCWSRSSISSGALGQGPHWQTRLTSSLLFTQRPHGLNPAFHILPAAYVGLYLLSNLAPHLSTDWVPPQGSETLCYWISSDILSL